MLTRERICALSPAGLDGDPVLEATYPIAPRGLATSFTESDTPIQYASRFKNRFINQAGAAEKRQGIIQLGADVGLSPTLDSIHELIEVNGTATLFVAGEGRIYRYNAATSSYSQVHSGLNVSARVMSVQMNDKLIFVNGVDRNIWTTDASVFTELRAIVEQGEATANTSAGALRDSDITNWIGGTDVTTNDVVYYVRQSAFGLVTAVTSAELTHTRVSAAGTGVGVGTEPTSGDAYEVIDTVELNIIPVGRDFDNAAVTTTGTNASVIAVSGVSFDTTQIRVGDFISNTTRNAVTRVLSVSANVRVNDVAAQVAGDSVVFLKSAMPISKFAHVHYSRLYHIDARDETRIRISGRNDPHDMTSDAGTLDSVSMSYGALQPHGDKIIALASFQQYAVLVGERNIYAFSGTNPIPASALASEGDFRPAGLFPQGALTSRGAQSIGNDMVFVSRDGLQAFRQEADASNLTRSNLSEAIRTTLRDELEDATEIVLFHYPRRSWLGIKVDSQLYIYSYSAQIDQAIGENNFPLGSWSVFDGLFARQKDYFVRSNGQLICCGANGKVYRYDRGTYNDDGTSIATEVRTAWLSLEEPRTSVRVKQLQYIKPLLEVGANISYTVRVEAPYDSESTDTATIAASVASSPIGLAAVGTAIVGGSPIANVKVPLRARGERFRLTFTNDTTTGPDIISKYTMYANLRGKQ